MRFLFLNGPNVNITRFTEPGVEGEIDYPALLDYLEACCQQMGIEPDFFQSNHEGDLIDEIQSAPGRADGIIINPGSCSGWTAAHNRIWYNNPLRRFAPAPPRGEPLADRAGCASNESIFALRNRAENRDDY